MAGEILEVGARVDSGAIVSGMQQAASATLQSTQQMGAAFGQLTEASVQTSAALGATEQAAVKTTQAMAKNTLVTKAAKEAASQNAIEQMRQYQAYLKAGEGAEKAGHAVVSGQQAASAAIRTLEGNAGLRAIENFVAKTLGLGPALQMVFPIIGALAFGKILFDMGEKVYEIGKKAVQSSALMTDAFREIHEKAAVANDDLRITNDRLQMAIDKLEGHPGNGAMLALDEARLMADKLAVSLRNDRKELDALLKENNVSFIGEQLSGVAKTGKQHEEMMADQKQLAKEIDDAGREFRKATSGSKDEAYIKAQGDVRDRAIKASYQKQIDSYRIEKVRLEKEQSQSLDDAMVAGGQGRVIDNSTKITGIRERTQMLVDAVEDENQKEANVSLVGRQKLDEQAKEEAENAKKKTAAAKAASREAAAAQRAALEDRIRHDEEVLNTIRAAGNISAEAEYVYWGARKMAFAAGSHAYQIELQKQAAAGQAMIREERTEKKRQAAEEKKDGEEASKALIEGARGMERWTAITTANLARTGEKWDSYWREVAKGEEIQTQVTEQMALLSVHTAEAEGRITHLSALHQEAGIHAKEHADNIATLRLELAKLQAQATINIFGNVDDPKIAAQIKGVQNQIAQEQGKGKEQSGSDQAGIAAAKAAPFKAATQQISSGLSGALASWEKGQGSFVSSWGKSLGSMLTGLQATLVQMGARWVEHYALQRLLHAATAVQKSSTDIAAKATTATTTAAVNTAAVLSEAAVAGAAAFASTAAIPIVGPALAPAAAGAAYASVAAMAPLASAQGGWDVVPADNTLANLHKNEMVLPAHLAEGVRKMTKGGDTITNHFGGNTYGGGDKSFREQLNDHEEHLSGMYARMQRDRAWG